MMTRSAALLAVIGLAVSAPAASAQPQPPIAAPSPAFSPYLNMLGPWGPAYGYFGLTQPQIQLMQQTNQLQQQVQLTNANLQSLRSGNVAGYGVNPNFPLTGRGATYNYLGHWYPLARNGGGAGSSGGATRPPQVIRRNY